MHVTSGYYETTLVNFPTKPVRINDPERAAKPVVLNDRGANGLREGRPRAHRQKSSGSCGAWKQVPATC